MQSKFCPACEQHKDTSDFNKQKASRDGLNRYCRVCKNAKQRERYAKSPQGVLDSNTKYRLANKERINRKRRGKCAEDATYRAAIKTKNRQAFAFNRESRLAKIREYKKVNRSATLAAARERKQKVRVATPPWLTSSQKAQIVSVYKHARDCFLCTGERYDVDHIIPLRGENVCGLHVPWNLQVLPSDVNRAKWNHCDGT